MAQLTWVQQTLCGVQDVKNRLNSPEIAFQVDKNASNFDALIQSKIDLSKDWIRQELINYFQQKIPTQIKSFLAFKRSQVDNAQSEFSRNLELADRGLGSWSYPTYGFFSFEGLFIDISGYATYSQVPLLRFNYGVPVNGTSGTFAGLAINGDVLADMQNRNLYINRWYWVANADYFIKKITAS